jgi:hypothetical protein
MDQRRRNQRSSERAGRYRRAGWRLALALAIVAVLIGPIQTAIAQTADPATQSPEAQLAAKHAPIVYLATQAHACDPNGEPFEPTEVEVVLGDEAVALRQPDDNPLPLLMGPLADALFRQGNDLFLDYPGNPRRPGCDYERRFKERRAGPAIAYAHIATEEGEPGLALQYWFFYYFNDWNNTHEGDWEMIQLVFDAGTAAEALTQEPVAAAFAQHANGETAGWTESKLVKEGNRPVVYVSHGSHASYFGDNVYLGYGEAGSGFGCDDASGPARRLPLEARLVPSAVDDQDLPTAWVTYDGHWGERQRSFWNGPTGPNTKRQWTEPFSWMDGLRGASVNVADRRDSPGPDPVDVFCAVVGGGSEVLNLFDLYPRLGYITLGVALLVAVALFLLTHRALGTALGMYLRHIRTFLPIGLALIPIAVAVNILHLLIISFPPVEFILRLLAHSPTAAIGQTLAIGGLHQLTVLLVVAPAVIVALKEIRAGRSPSARAAYGAAFDQLLSVGQAVFRSLAIVFLLAISVVGLPWAIRQSVRWSFVNQGVILDGARDQRALHASARAVAGRWWQTAGAVIALTLAGAALGPLIGIALLIFSSLSVELVSTLSGLIYAATVPFTVIGFSLLYLNADRTSPDPTTARASMTNGRDRPER